jgi:general secretion pathway protein D
VGNLEGNVVKIPQLIGIAFVVLGAHVIVFAPAMVWAQDDQTSVPAMPPPVDDGVVAPDQQIPPPPPPEVPEAAPMPDQPVAPPPLPPVPPGGMKPQRPKMTPRPTIRPSERGRLPMTPPGVPRPPSAQVEPSTDNLPKDGGTPDQPAKFDFNDMPLTSVVESLAKMTGKNFDVDPTIANTRVTIITHDEIPPEMAYEVMAAVLNARGFALVPTLDGHMIRIVPVADNSSGDKIRLSKGMDGVGKHDEVSTHIITVEHADAAELATFIKDLGSRNSVVSAYAKTNTLIMTDTADGLRRMFDFLKEVDISGFDTQMEIFTLVYSRAEILSSQIMEVLNETGASPMQRPGMPAQPARPSQPTRVPPMRPTVPGQPSSMIVGNKQEVLRIVPDERLNALIVIATNSSMDKVRDLVAKLDTPTPYEANNMNVYKLLNADSEKVEKALNAILGTTPRQGGDKGGGGGGVQQGEVQPFEKKVVVTRYESSNALLILASPQDYKVIKELIAQLDVPQRQVLVEAIIMDVSLQDQFGLAVDQAYVEGNDAFGMGNTSNINSLLSLTDAASMATSLSSGTAGLALAKQLLSLGNNGGMSVGAFQSLEAKVGNKTYKIPFVPFLIKALETLTDVDILSQPTLTTQDNESADIVVGQELPVPTVRSGYSYNPTGTGTTTNPATNYPAYGMQSYGGNSGISRQDVGVKMKVKPHINEGDYVSMETEIEVSEATQSDIGINANELGPTFNKSKVTNNVVVRDGSTSVVGGLIKETANHTRKQAPILGDIPVLGFLFRTKNDTRKKQDVVVLLTPHIIKEGSDLDRLSEYKMEEFRTSNVDALFESGLIKKTKKATYMRTKYRPSVERSEKMREPAKFSRGNIERE